MKFQDIIDVVNDIFSNSLVASLLGVVVGGVITHLGQKNFLKQQQQFESEKIANEEIKKNEEIKIRAYNKILHLNSVYMISEWDHHTGRTELYDDNFHEHIQPIMYEIYHLLSDKIANEFDYIETSFERISTIGPEDDDKWILGESYSRILQEIRKEFEAIRNSRLSN